MKRNIFLASTLIGLCMTTPIQADHHEEKSHCSDKSCTCTPKEGEEKSEDGVCTCENCKCEGCKEHGNGDGKSE
ncbi:MAG TPA: hypothetical protein PKA63_14010 [Oligoflexia bacterium]|nr:hypothetical protein [Oligoflexia bacterium]HMP49778.1 hypothetical protein [Oligoflexia bacterium]